MIIYTLVEIRRTPIGDGNYYFIIVITHLKPVEIRRTPIGDGNTFYPSIRWFLLLVEIRRTPIGDGNSFPDNTRTIKNSAVEIRRTPIGDGNRCRICRKRRSRSGRNKKNPDRGRKHNILFVKSNGTYVEIRRTPIGDGNEFTPHTISTLFIVEIRRTPIGDGNISLINCFCVINFCRNKKNPDRGRKRHKRH